MQTQIELSESTWEININLIINIFFSIPKKKPHDTFKCSELYFHKKFKKLIFISFVRKLYCFYSFLHYFYSKMHFFIKINASLEHLLALRSIFLFQKFLKIFKFYFQHLYVKSFIFKLNF